jgi:hypothetical protein
VEDPSSKHLWFEAIGGLTLIAVIAILFLVGVIRAEKNTGSRQDESSPTASTNK